MVKPEHIREGASKTGAFRIYGSKVTKEPTCDTWGKPAMDRPMETGKETSSFWIRLRPLRLRLFLHIPPERFNVALLLLLTLDS